MSLDVIKCHTKGKKEHIREGKNRKKKEKNWM